MKNLILVTFSLGLTNSGLGQCDFSLGYGDPACAGICNGMVGVNTINGTAPFSFSWSTGDTTFLIDDLCTGTYVLTLTDGLGCVYTDSVTLNDPPGVAFTVDADYVSGTSAPGWCDGQIILTVQGGTPDYTYYWKYCATQQYYWSMLPYFCPGEYYCVAVDDNGCIDSTECITISDPVAGITQAKTQDYFQVFPNPVQSEVNLTLTEIPQEYEIYSMSGQRILSGFVKNNKIDLTDLEPGEYILKISSDEHKFATLILKE